MNNQALFERYYFNRSSFVNGTQLFHQMCEAHLRTGTNILEIGAGPSNPTSRFLTQIGDAAGVDVSQEVLNNSDLARVQTYDGITIPYPDNTFDLCVSNYVIEHVVDPLPHFQESFRILKPGGSYCFRTPNLWHYVTIGSRLLSHSTHLRIANKLRGLAKDAHDPWPTVYRANTRGRLRALAKQTGWLAPELCMIEAEPSYGASHRLFFYPMMAYERLVNSSEFFEPLRVNIFGAFRKPNARLQTSNLSLP